MVCTFTLSIARYHLGLGDGSREAQFGMPIKAKMAGGVISLVRVQGTLG
jgi:hypothetical protein